MTNDETDITMALPWSMVSSSSDRRHEDMDDGDDDDTDDDHDDDTDDDNDQKNDSYTAAGAAPGASVPCSFSWVPVEGSFVLVPSFWFLRSCLLYTSPSPRDGLLSRMPSSA